MYNSIKIDLEPYTSVTVSSLKEVDDLLEDVLSLDFQLQPRIIDKPVILYGAGSLGKMARDFFTYLKIPFLYIVDKNANQNKKDESWKNIDIVHPDEVGETHKKNNLLVICVVTTPLIPLRDELKNNGWEDIAFFYDISQAYCDRHPLNNGWFLGKLNDNDKESIRKVFSLFADDVSRSYYVQFITWRKLRTELLFSDLEINNDNRFFIPEITNVLRGDEIFLDCGAHKGSVIEKYLKLVNKDYKEIWAIEPDPLNIDALKTRLVNKPNIHVINHALSNKNGKEKFYQGFNFASKLSENGNDIIDITKLDRLNIAATFIKMHLEGGELNAITGAQKTIKENRPIIAITLYHNSDGVWRIILFLMNLLENYCFHFRLHSWAGTGAVLYAIPIERNKW
ncbi:MAG: FkbM family methyltransferase [Bacteroidetes bacterium]|nr:FkbM family methyltransferase [Bacteroidota bacterium]